MKRSLLVASAVALFLAGAAFHYALAAEEDVMNTPLVVTKGMWVNLVLAAFQPPSGGIQYTFDPVSNTLNGHVRSGDPKVLAAAEVALAKMQALLAPAFPAAKTATTVGSKPTR